MFVDTSVLVHARIREAPRHDEARVALGRAMQGSDMPGSEPLRISRQVMREYLAVITWPQTWPVAVSRVEALHDMLRLAPIFQILEDGPAVTDQLAALSRVVTFRGSQVHDANIVATMLAYGERRLLTFNREDFLRYGDRIELVEL